MKKLIEILSSCAEISDWKINIHRRESCELFFIKDKLDCARRTDTTNNRITVYVDRDGYRGDAVFYAYPSTTEEELRKLCSDTAKRAALIKNAHYSLPEGGVGEYTIESNFSEYEPMALAKEIAAGVFAANGVDGAAINALEVFVTKHCDKVINSLGLDKTQTRYDAMVEAIPTFDGEGSSVELYEQYNFSLLDPEALKAEIAGKMEEVKARSEATAPNAELKCNVIFNKGELAQLFRVMAKDIDYGSVYSQISLHKKGEAIQLPGSGDRINLTLCASLPGSVSSSLFDMDGMSLGEKEVIEGGIVKAYHGSNRFGQYIGEEPSGSLPCMKVAPGSAEKDDFSAAPALEVLSMSGLQVDFYSDYIGGEVRLAYYHDGEKTLPLTGISVSGKLSEVLSEIRLSSDRALSGAYFGPEKALIGNMKIF